MRNIHLTLPANVRFYKKTIIFASVHQIRGGFWGVDWVAGHPLPWATIALSFRIALVAREVVVFICLFFKMLTENFYKLIQVTQIYNLFLLLSAQACCQKWLSKCWKCHCRDPRTKKFPGACPGPPRRLWLSHRPPPFNNPRSDPANCLFLCIYTQRKHVSMKVRRGFKFLVYNSP